MTVFADYQIDRYIVDEPMPDLTAEQRMEMQAWVDGKLADFQRQILGDWLYEATFKPADAVAPEANPYSPAAPRGAESL